MSLERALMRGGSARFAFVMIITAEIAELIHGFQYAFTPVTYLFQLSQIRTRIGTFPSLTNGWVYWRHTYTFFCSS